VTTRPTRRTVFLFVIILAAAALLRVVDLDRLPPGLFVDEAFTGYDAYSILETGRDMWGERFPVFFRSWGDYNSGLYRYLTVPWVAALGLNEGAVRAAAALAGVLTVFLAYLLGSRLFSRRVGLAAAAFLAVSPWHLQFSRIGFRGILLPLFLTAGVVAFEHAVRRGTWRLIGAAAVFGVALYTYSPARVIVPLMLVVLGVMYRRRLGRRPAVLGAVVLLVLLAIPLISITLSGEGQQRYEIMSIFRAEGAETTSGLALFARNYVSHFSPRFLLVSGDVNLRHSPPGIGQLNWGVFLLFIVGLAAAVARRKRRHVLLMAWLLVAAIPDSLTTDNVPNALRSITMLPAIQVLAAVGLFEIIDGRWAGKLRAARVKPAIIAGLVLGLAILGAARSLSVYFGEYRARSAPWWDYGYREAIEYAESVEGRYQGIAVLAPCPESMRTYANNPYAFIFPLFYTAHDPATLHRRKNTGKYALLTPPAGAPVTDDMLRPGILYILRGERARIADPLHVVPYPSGEPAFVLAERPAAHQDHDR
jgi:4-amino-4-deoxy-L-arabinose transferase-like glycosyltransferase